MSLRTPSAVALMLFAAGCATPKFDVATEQHKLLLRDAEWAQLSSAGKDVDKTASYWSDDALIIPQAGPIVEGKAAIRAMVADSFKTPGFSIHWKSEQVQFSPDGKMAYMRSTTDFTMPGPNGTVLLQPSRGITVWRLEADGQWRRVVDIWNDPPRAKSVTK